MPTSCASAPEAQCDTKEESEQRDEGVAHINHYYRSSLSRVPITPNKLSSAEIGILSQWTINRETVDWKSGVGDWNLLVSLLRCQHRRHSGCAFKLATNLSSESNALAMFLKRSSGCAIRNCRVPSAILDLLILSVASRDVMNKLCDRQTRQ